MEKSLSVFQADDFALPISIPQRRLFVAVDTARLNIEKIKES
jgi:hypothetical protein